MISIALYRNVHHDSDCGCDIEVDFEYKEDSHNKDHLRDWKYRYLYIAPPPNTRLCKRDQVMVIYALNSSGNQPHSLETANSMSTL